MKLNKVIRNLTIFVLIVLLTIVITQFYSYFEFISNEGKIKLSTLTFNYLKQLISYYYIVIPIILLLTYIVNKAFISTNLIIYKKIFIFILMWLFIGQMLPIIPIAILMIFFKLKPTDLMLLATNPAGFSLNHLFFISIFILIGTILTYYLVRIKIDKKQLNNFGYDIKKGYAKNSILGFFTGMLFITIGFVIMILTDVLSVQSIGSTFFQQIFYILFFVVMAANEEIMFRGYILETLLETESKVKALIISSVIFAVLHCLNPNLTWVSVLNISIAGFLLGISYIYVRNLWFPTMLHFAWNYFQGPVFGFAVSGLKFNGIIQHKLLSGNSYITGGEFGLEGSLITTFIMILFIFGINFYFKKQSKSITNV